MIYEREGVLHTFRPEFGPPWIGRSYVTSLTINRLAGRDVGSMIDGVIGNKSLPAPAKAKNTVMFCDLVGSTGISAQLDAEEWRDPNIRQDIIERTDGIPLFVEEMTKAVLEAESDDEARRTAAIPSPALAVPVSLHALLMARLDRLGGPAKEVAQIGAAIGREQPHALLALVTRKPDAELEAALNRLVAAGLLFRQGLPVDLDVILSEALSVLPETELLKPVCNLLHRGPPTDLQSSELLDRQG